MTCETFVVVLFWLFNCFLKLSFIFLCRVSPRHGVCSWPTWREQLTDVTCAFDQHGVCSWPTWCEQLTDVTCAVDRHDVCSWPTWREQLTDMTCAIDRHGACSWPTWREQLTDVSWAVDRHDVRGWLAIKCQVNTTVFITLHLLLRPPQKRYCSCCCFYMRWCLSRPRAISDDILLQRYCRQNACSDIRTTRRCCIYILQTKCLLWHTPHKRDCWIAYRLIRLTPHGVPVRKAGDAMMSTSCLESQGCHLIPFFFLSLMSFFFFSFFFLFFFPPSPA